MGLDGNGLRHGLVRQGYAQKGRHAWLVDAVHRTELQWEAREDRKFGGHEQGVIDPEGRK